MSDEIDQQPIGSRFRPRLFVLLFLVLLLIGFIGVWLQRVSIADNFVRSELEQLDVKASYEIEDIGVRKQIIRNLVIGDPERPDLTAELVEVGAGLGSQGAGVNWVRAKGVKIFARVVDGKLSLGELDKFTDPDDDSPLALPAIWLEIEDGQMRVDSDYGAIGISLHGEGHLHSGFRGEMAAISEQLVLGDCRLNKPSYFGTISIDDKSPRLKGPLRLPEMKCPGLGISSEDLAAQIAVTLGEDLASWQGNIGLVGGPVRYSDYSVQEIKTTVRFSGDMQSSKGDIELGSSGLLSAFGGANTARFSGPFAIGYGDEQLTASFEGEPEIRSARLSRRLIEQMTSVANSADATPIGPIAGKLAAAVRNAGRSLNIRSALTFKTGTTRTTLAIDRLDVDSRSGVSATLSDPMLLAFTGNNIRMLADGNIRIGGGGLPNVRLRLDDGSLSRGFSGRLEMAAYQAGSARLNIPALRFSPARGGGTDIDGRLILTGPLPDGQVTGLQLPISGSLGRNGGFALFRQCVNVQFASLKMAALTAGPTNARLCPAGMGAIVSSRGSGVNIAGQAPSLNVNGAVGGTPLSVSSGALGFSLANGMTARDISVRLGETGNQSEFDMALLTAAFGSDINGRMEGGNGKVASVPLLMSAVEGEWRYENGAFLIDAMLRVRDEQQVARFQPLVSKDVQLKFADNRITADGQLLEPTTERAIAQVDIVHRLGDNSGEALLDVGALRFDTVLQPEMLTPLTLGVIANVDGTVTGTGKIVWDSEGDGIHSTGSFQTDSINLAAAFGPVTGLSGEIMFTDLLALETAPGQIARIKEVNPGVAAFNGILNYRILPNYQVQVEGGRWPFAGGELLLEPTVLDMGEDKERRLEFTVTGVDAAQFLTQFEFENLSATGVFDGKLPMVFDQDGGRITGGYLVAREGGGTLAYVGELTYEDMGTIANFAFNALKSVKYRNLTIGMDGAIDGEIITEVKFAGLQQGDDASKNFITRQLAQIPIEFNVRIQAPFMQLMSSARAYYEPEILVGQNLPALLRAKEARAKEAIKEIEAKQ